MYRCTLALGALAYAWAGPAGAARLQFIDAKLVAATDAPRPGQTILLGLEMIPQRGWHGYWSNPGESGLAPVVKWTAHRGVHFGEVEHPAPTLMNVMGMTSYVHIGPHILLTNVRLDANLPRGAILPIVADVTWAACSDKLCVPEKARLALRLKVGNGEPSPQAGLLRAALAREPRRIGPGSVSARGERIVLRLPASARLRPFLTRFFPDENGYWDPVQTRVAASRPLTLVSPSRGRLPKVITGVVSDGSSAYRLSFEARTDR
jgi:DsbC/DsbD-like thiol-disulfide interchange protein